MIHPFDRKIDRATVAAMLDQPHKGDCKAPFVVTDAERNPMLVPCNQCLPCRKRRVDIWIGRAMAETHTNPNAQFLTLTYSDEYLIERGLIGRVTGDWVKKETRSFIKRLRRVYPGARHALVFQLGTETQRPHIHALIWAKEYQELEWGDPLRPGFIPADNLGAARGKIHSDKGFWSRGHRDAKPLDVSTARYTFQYISKPGKGTVHQQKSTLIGEAYFLDWLKTHKKYPRMYPGAYYVPDQYGHPKWYPMDRRFREIARDNGYDHRLSNQSEFKNYKDWLYEAGPALRDLRDKKDRAAQGAIERIPGKPRESAEAARLKAEIQASKGKY